MFTLGDEQISSHDSRVPGPVLTSQRDVWKLDLKK